jgi:hypothetical protein
MAQIYVILLGDFKGVWFGGQECAYLSLPVGLKNGFCKVSLEHMQNQ